MVNALDVQPIVKTVIKTHHVSNAILGIFYSSRVVFQTALNRLFLAIVFVYHAQVIAVLVAVLHSALNVKVIFLFCIWEYV